MVWHKLIKHLQVLGVFTLIIMSLAACGQRAESGTGDLANAANGEQKVRVVATLYPQYDFAKALMGEKAEVRLLMPPGTESHSYDPTPKDLADIQNADVFIYTSELMEPWVPKILDQIGTETLVINATEHIAYKSSEALGFEEHEAEDSDHGEEGLDPHVWLDLDNAALMVQNVAKGLSKADPGSADQIKAAEAAYLDALNALDDEMAKTLGQAKNREIVFAGHFAFGYFAAKYDLGYRSPYEGFSPDAEPTPQKIAEMIDHMKAEGQTAVFYEELIDPKIGRVIAEETGAELLMLHAAHNVSKEDLQQGLTYLEIMRNNLNQLKKGLDIHE